MRSEWLGFCQELMLATPDLQVSGTKKIFHNRVLTFQNPWGPLPSLEEVGFKAMKLRVLQKNYVHQESLEVAVEMWRQRRAKGRYGSVGFTCYNHLKKAWSGKNANKRSSNMGPCLQSVVLTQKPKRRADITVFYRTTELIKKFPADLILIRDSMISQFDLTGLEVEAIHFHFANLTISPDYLLTLIVLIEDPFEFLEKLRIQDPSFFKAATRRIRTHLGDKHKIKFKQIRRVGEAFHRVADKDLIEDLRDYLTEIPAP